MLKNVGSSWVVTGATILVVFFLTRYVIDVLGDVRYGLWLTVAAATGYLQMIRGGVPAASIRNMAEALGRTDDPATTESVNRIIASCIVLYLALAAIALVAGFALLSALDAFWDVPPGLVPEFRVAFTVAVFNVALAFVAHLPFAVMQAHDDFVPYNWVRLSGLASRAVLTVVLLSISESIAVLAIVLLLVTAIEMTVSTGMVRRRYPGVRLGVAARDRTETRRLAGFSAWLLLMVVGSRLSFQTDPLVISKLGSLADVAIYGIANQILLYKMEIVAAIAMVMVPRAAKLQQSSDLDTLRNLLYRWSKVTFSLSLFVGCFLIVMGAEFMTWWIDVAYGVGGGPALRILTLSFLVFLPVQGVAEPILVAMGKVAVPAAAYLVMGIVNVVLSVLLIPEYGITGVAVGTAIPNALFAGYLLTYACRQLDVPLRRYLGYVGVKATVGAVPLLAWLTVCRYVFGAQGLWGLAYSGIGTAALFVATWIGFVYRNDPHLDVEGLVRHARTRLFGQGTDAVEKN